MLNFKTFIKEDKIDYYYHGTSPDSAEEILKNGIDPNKSKYKNTIYLTNHHGEAQRYSKIANGGKLGVVLKIPRNVLNDDEIATDRAGIIEYKGKIHPKHLSRV